MMSEQLAFPQPRAEAWGREDFMVTASNAQAVALLDGWRAWPQGRLGLVGPKGSGKSHLATIWAEEAGARSLRAADVRADQAPSLAEGPVVVEDVDRGGQDEALFHLWNACARSGQPLLLTGRGAPSDWGAKLPDLQSRLASLTPAVIEAPDDTLLPVLLLKLFADRQLTVRPNLIGWLLRRMERSHAAALHTVAQLDAAALSRGCEVDIKLARDVLGLHASGD